MTDKYILRGHEAVPFDTDTTERLLEWARWFEEHDRRVARTQVGAFDISTVFLGLDHNFMGNRPLIFETIVFKPGGCGAEQTMDRYSTWDEAEAGHAALVKHFTRAVNG